MAFALRTTLTMLALCATFAVTATARAGTGYLDDGGHINMARDAGAIDHTEALWLRYLMHFEPEALPDAYRGAQRSGWRCSTPLVAMLKENWHSFDRDQRARMTAQLAPWKDDLVDDAPIESAPTPLDDDTCWGQYGDYRILSEHFSVEWDGNTISQNTAQSFSDALEYSWQVEVEELGWREPDGSNNYLMLAYVAPGNYGGAYTTGDMCNNDYVPYIVAYAGSFASGSWYQDMACHEFNHAMQFGYGMAHEFYWWEATATYIEDSVYPAHHGWSPYLVGYTDKPWLAMNASSQDDDEIFNHMYGMAIFGFYLHEYVGGGDLVRQTWQESSSYGGAYSLWIGDLLEDMGYDFDEVYRGFMATNTVMEYEEQAYFPAINTTEGVGQLPGGGESYSEQEPHSYGQNYITIDTDEASSNKPDLFVTVDGEEDGQWEAILVATSASQVLDMVPLEFDGEHGEGRLTDFGDYREAWLVVSPTHNTGRSYSYQYTAEAVAGEGSSGDDDDDDDDDGDDDDGGISGYTTDAEGDCSCRSDGGAAAPLAGLLLLGVMGLLRLRR